jgi:hypothetical protein
MGCTLPLADQQGLFPKCSQMALSRMPSGTRSEVESISFEEKNGSSRITYWYISVTNATPRFLSMQLCTRGNPARRVRAYKSAHTRASVCMYAARVVTTTKHWSAKRAMCAQNCRHNARSSFHIRSRQRVVVVEPLQR